MALIVYLDTQDYINLFNEPDSGPNHRVLTDLITRRDRDQITIGFSFATVVEFITKPSAKYRDERVKRGQLIKEICGPNAFPYPTDIPRGAKFPNAGRWMLRSDSKIISAQRFRRMIQVQLEKKLNTVSGLNRIQRRKLKAKGSFPELLRKTGTTWGRERADWGDFPVSDELLQSRIVERFIKGQCSDQEFEARISAWLSDPAEYSRIFYDYSDHPNVIDKFFGDSIKKLEQSLSVMQNAVAKLQILEDERLEQRSKLIKVGVEKRRARELTKKPKIESLDFSEIESNLESVIGVGRAGHFVHYVDRLLKPGYVFKKSDVMDLMQMCYAYECDLFRCDKDMAHNFRDFEPFIGKLVGRFSELPDRIDELCERLQQFP